MATPADYGATKTAEDGSEYEPVPRASKAPTRRCLYVLLGACVLIMMSLGIALGVLLVTGTSSKAAPQSYSGTRQKLTTSAATPTQQDSKWKVKTTPKPNATTGRIVPVSNTTSADLVSKSRPRGGGGQFAAVPRPGRMGSGLAHPDPAKSTVEPSVKPAAIMSTAAPDPAKSTVEPSVKPVAIMSTAAPTARSPVSTVSSHAGPGLARPASVSGVATPPVRLGSSQGVRNQTGQGANRTTPASPPPPPHKNVTTSGQASAAKPNGNVFSKLWSSISGWFSSLGSSIRNAFSPSQKRSSVSSSASSATGAANAKNGTAAAGGPGVRNTSHPTHAPHAKLLRVHHD